MLTGMSGVIPETRNEGPLSNLGPAASLSQPSPPRRVAETGRSVGILLYLVSVGLVAAAIIGVFFGTGFLLLGPRAGGASSGSAARDPGTEVRSPVSGLVLPSHSDHPPADGKLGPITVETEMPGPHRAADASVAPLGLRPVPDDEPLSGNNEAARNSTALPSASEAQASATDETPSSGEALAEGSTAKATSTATQQSAAARERAPHSFVSPTLASPNPRLSATEISELVGHGDAFFGMGDVASARLFYERAAAAGDGKAALRLGASFDPMFLGRAGLRNVRGDPAEARFWYTRAIDLGTAKAARQLNGVETKQGQ
jgi:hypothetical protein